MMKKFTFYILFLFCFTSVTAQTINFDYEQVEASGTPDEFSVDIYNTLTLTDSEKTAQLNWFFESFDCPEEWGVFMCDENVCFATTASTMPILVEPNAGAEVKMQFRANGVEGAGYAVLSFTEVSDPSVAATSTFYVSISPETGFSITPVEPMFNFYPNPVVDIMNIELENYPEVSKIGIYNLVGKEVKAVYTEDNIDKINTSDLIQGMYLVVLEDANGKLLETRRFSKIY